MSVQMYGQSGVLTGIFSCGKMRYSLYRAVQAIFTKGESL